MMDVEILSRVQFAFTIAFHYIFPPFTIGLGVQLVIMQALWLRTRKPIYHNMARFWTRVFGLIFAIGVASGIVMEFEFGTNWAVYSRFVGDVFGSALAAEGLYAFFLESGFLAILLFGWDKVGPKTHFFATCMVCLGAHFSAVWILIANSWMQTPAGYHLVKRVKLTEDGVRHPYSVDLGETPFVIEESPLPADYILQTADIPYVRAAITDFLAMLLNPSSVDRLIHTILGCWMAGAFLVVSISAYYLLKGRHTAFAKGSMRIGLAFGTVATLLQMVSADATARGVAENQPVKLAAIEGLAHTQAEAPLSIGGWVGWERDEAGNITGIREYTLKMPMLLSILVSGDFLHPLEASATVVPGLHDLPSDAFLQARYPDATAAEIEAIRPQYWPNVPVVFQTYHLMIAIGVAMVGLVMVACFYWARGWLWDVSRPSTRWLLWVLVFSVFGPQIAGQAGWFTAEMGRQPWVVYEILKTSEGLSEVVRAEQVLFSLIMFALIYALLFFVFIYTLLRKVRHGPRDDESIEILPERWRPMHLKGGRQLDA